MNDVTILKVPKILFSSGEAIQWQAVLGPKPKNLWERVVLNISHILLPERMKVVELTFYDRSSLIDAIGEAWQERISEWAENPISRTESLQLSFDEDDLTVDDNIQDD